MGHHGQQDGPGKHGGGLGKHGGGMGKHGGRMGKHGGGMGKHGGGFGSGAKSQSGLLGRLRRLLGGRSHH